MLPKNQSVSETQQKDCVRALQTFESLVLEKKVNKKKTALLRQQMTYLLQFITINTDKSIYTITPEELSPWWSTAFGFYEHDLRSDLVNLLYPIVQNKTLIQKQQPGSRFLRKLSEILFWRNYQKNVWARTKDFFSNITQDDILIAEKNCVPFYQAMYEVYPEIGYGGVFDEADEELVQILNQTVHKKSNLHITDIGCGKGRLLARIAKDFPKSHLYGTSIFEFSEQDRKFLNDKGITPIFCTANKINIPDNSQDIVVSTEVIEHLRHPNELVKEMARILKPGGIFYTTAPGKVANMYCKNPFSYLGVALSVVCPKILPPFHNLYTPLTPIKIVHYGFDLEDYRALFKKYFPEVKIFTSRFVALKKFKLDKLAPKLPILRSMGGLLIATGKKTGAEK